MFNLKICIFAAPNNYNMTDTKFTIADRLAALREEMRRERLSAFIFPSADPHMSEYVPERWEGRKWISGFDGSAGTAVVTLHSAALWTDSRYFLAAEQQLESTEFQLMRERLASTPSIADWLAREVHDGEPTEGKVSGPTWKNPDVKSFAARVVDNDGAGPLVETGDPCGCRNTWSFSELNNNTYEIKLYE